MRLKMDSSSMIWALNTTSKTGESSNFPELFNLKSCVIFRKNYSYYLQLLAKASPMNHFQKHLSSCTDFDVCKVASWAEPTLQTSNLGWVDHTYGSSCRKEVNDLEKISREGQDMEIKENCYFLWSFFRKRNMLY